MELGHGVTYIDAEGNKVMGRVVNKYGFGPSGWESIDIAYPIDNPIMEAFNVPFRDDRVGETHYYTGPFRRVRADHWLDSV